MIDTLGPLFLCCKYENKLLKSRRWQCKVEVKLVLLELQ